MDYICLCKLVLIKYQMYIKDRILVLCIIIKYKNPHTGCFTGSYPTGGNVGVYDLKLYTSHCPSCFVLNLLVYDQ